MKRAVEQTGWTKSLEKMIEKMSENIGGLKNLVETFKKKHSQDQGHQI